MFPDSPVIAMTATASYTDMSIIQETLGLKKCKLVVANPDRQIFTMTKSFDMVMMLLNPF